MARGHARSNKLLEIGVKALRALVSLKFGSARMSGVGLANRISRLPRVLIRKVVGVARALRYGIIGWVSVPSWRLRYELRSLQFDDSHPAKRDSASKVETCILGNGIGYS